VAVWIVAGAALLLALALLGAVRRLARRLDALNQSYWELRYDYTRLRSQVARLDPEHDDPQPPEPPQTAGVSFVPLSSMRKKDQQRGHGQ
jgi:hypothetical protein